MEVLLGHIFLVVFEIRVGHEFRRVFLIDKKSKHQQRVVLFLKKLVFNLLELKIGISLKLELFTDIPEHILDHLSESAHELKMTFGEFLFMLFVLAPDIGGVVLLFFLEL